MGLGKAGTKEANKFLICQQVELRRSVLLSHPEPLELDDDSFADRPVRLLASLLDWLTRSCINTLTQWDHFSQCITRTDANTHF